MTKWETEPIPDTDCLFRRIHQNCFKHKNHVPLGPYERKGSVIYISTDWDKHSTAEKCRRRSPRHGPEVYGIVRFNVGELRQDNHIVCHDPICCNQSHTHICGEESALKWSITERASWIIQPSVS